MLPLPSSSTLAALQNRSVALEFKHVRDNAARMEIVRRVLSEVYSDPSVEIGQIAAGVNRTCRLLYVNGLPKAIVVYKDATSDTCSHYGSRNSLEIRILRLLDPERDSRRGLCTELFKKVQDAALEKEASAIHVKLRPSDQGLISFYRRRGFSIIADEINRESGQVEKLVLQKLCHHSVDLRSVRVVQPSPPVPRLEPPRPLQMSRTTVTPLTPRPLARGDYRDMTLKNPYVRFIKEGLKTVEGRICSGIFQFVRVGERFRFFNTTDEVFCRVIGVRRYSSFPEMLRQEDYRVCIPEARSLEAACAVYAGIPGYADRAAASGVVALHITLEPAPIAPRLPLAPPPRDIFDGHKRIRE